MKELEDVAAIYEKEENLDDDEEARNDYVEVVLAMKKYALSMKDTYTGGGAASIFERSEKMPWGPKARRGGEANYSPILGGQKLNEKVFGTPHFSHF